MTLIRDPDGTDESSSGMTRHEGDHTMRGWTTTVLMPLGFAASLATLSMLNGCATPNQYLSWDSNGQPRTDHPEQSWWHYEFVYHPQAELYYEPYTKRYFWFDEHRWEWMSSNQPPRGTSVDPTVSKVVRVKTQDPHMDHVTVLAVAGPQWRGAPSSWETGQVDDTTQHATVHYSGGQD